jgi:hypothetical protein
VQLWLLLALLAGCDKLFEIRRLDHVDAASDGVMGDAQRDAPDAPPDGLMQTHSNCPTAFGLPYENSKYQYLSAQLTWPQALAACKALDDATSTKRVHLAVLTGDPERVHVYVNVVGSASKFWIGLSDTVVDGTYKWVTAEQVTYPVTATWASGEPSIDPLDDCVFARASTTDFDSVACSTTSQLVCECDDYAYEPANYNLM